MNPAILAAAAVMLLPQLAPSIGPIPCQTDPRIIQQANHASVQWRGGWHHHRHCVRVAHHWRCR
jgi:hypothetical protein